MFNLFASVCHNNTIYLILVARIRLVTFLTTILFLMLNCTVTIYGNTRNGFKCAVICSRSAARLLDSLWKLSIYSWMSRFMEHMSLISELYISAVSLILLMVVTCAAHVRSYFLKKITVYNINTYGYNHQTPFLSFNTCSKYFPLPYYHMHSDFIYVYFPPYST